VPGTGGKITRPKRASLDEDPDRDPESSDYSEKGNSTSPEPAPTSSQNRAIERIGRLSIEHTGSSTRGLRSTATGDGSGPKSSPDYGSGHSSSGEKRKANVDPIKLNDSMETEWDTMLSSQPKMLKRYNGNQLKSSPTVNMHAVLRNKLPNKPEEPVKKGMFRSEEG